MKYSYNINGRDLIYLNFYFMDQNDLKKARRNLKFSPLIFAVLIVFFKTLKDGLNANFIVASAILYLIWFFISDRILDRMAARRMNRAINTPENKWLTNTRTMTLEDDYISESIEMNNGESKELFKKSYGELTKIEASEHGIYIFLDDDAAFIMPRKAFDSAEEMKKTYSFIINKYNEEKQEENID